MAVQMPPILKDSTGQSINITLSGIDTTLGNANTNLAGIITALQALSAPSATNVAVSPTGLHYITEDDAQGALAELDAECFALNNSLTLLTTTESDTITGTYISTNGWTIKKIGKIVFLQIDTFKNIPNGSFTLDDIIPSKYRPTDTARIFTIVRRSTTLSPLALSVETTGSVICYNYASANDGSNYRDLISWSIN